MDEAALRTASVEKDKSLNFDVRFLKRLCRLLPWLFPSWKSGPTLLFLLLLCLGLLEQYVIYNIGMVPSKYYKVLGDKDSQGFLHQTIIAVLLIITEAFIKSTTTFVSSFLYITWREGVTQRLHSKYFRDVLYYSINVIDKTVDNPDQRITQDVDKLCNTLSQIVAPLIISPFTIGYYIYQAQTRSGYLGPVSVLVFFVIATVINKLLMSPVVHFVFKREKMEGNFRFKHMHIRSNSESAAFYRSGKIELQKTNRHLKQLIQTQHKLILRQYALNFSINVSDYLGSILSYIAIGFPIFLGVYDSLSAADLSALISANAFVVIYLISCFTKLIDLSVQVTVIAGTTHRVVELLEVLGKLHEGQRTAVASKPTGAGGGGGGGDWGEMEVLVDHEAGAPANGSVLGSRGSRDTRRSWPTSAFQVTDLAYMAPKSRTKLCAGLSFNFEAGTNILLTGQSGCGKSSLLRVINGIWPEVRGSIEPKVELRPHLILFLPQKPYFTDGSLMQQIIYPLREFDQYDKPICLDDELVLEYLEKTGLSPLSERVGGLDVEVDWNWYDELSPGEMQRLSFVRLFYHRPKFAVLDEATSQVGLDAEHALYTTCKELDITVLSVGHRDSLRQYHDVELNLNGAGGWSLKPIQESVC